MFSNRLLPAAAPHFYRRGASQNGSLSEAKRMAFFAAVENDDIDTAEILARSIDRMGILIGRVRNADERNAAHVATSNGNLAMLEMLLTYDSDMAHDVET